MKWLVRHERANPGLSGMGAGMMLCMGVVSLTEVLSPAPRHAAVHVVAIIGFVVGALLQYPGRAAKRAGGKAQP